jgi:hypothetical protein
MSWECKIVPARTPQSRSDVWCGYSRNKTLCIPTDVTSSYSSLSATIFSPQRLTMEISRSYFVSLASKKASRSIGKIRPKSYARCIATHTHSFHADQISVIRSATDTSSPEFKENEKQMKDAIARIRELNNKISEGGSTKAREKHVARGKMLARE